LLLGELAGLANAATWAITSLILGSLAGRHSALRVNTIRMCAGALYFLFVIPLAGGRALFAGLSLAHALALGGTSVLAQAIGDSLYVAGIDRLGAARASPISVSSFPLLTLVLGAVLLGERLTWAIGAGAVLIIGGILLLVLRSPVPAEDVPVPGSEGLLVLGDDLDTVPRAEVPMSIANTRPAGASFRGLALVLGAALAWATATLWLRVLAPGLPALTVTAVRVPCGAVFLLGLLTLRRQVPLAGISRRTLLLLVASGAFGTGFGSMLFIIAVQRTSAGIASLLVSTSPLWVIPLAAVFLHERLTRRELGGAALTIAGILLIVR
jgi:drug/metabolite transporter (DMT)-like permease